MDGQVQLDKGQGVRVHANAHTHTQRIPAATERMRATGLVNGESILRQPPHRSGRVTAIATNWPRGATEPTNKVKRP